MQHYELDRETQLHLDNDTIRRAVELFVRDPYSIQDINDWDVSNVTDMSLMFLHTKAFNQPLDAWNTSKVNDMNNMFSFTDTFNQSLSSWNIASLQNIDYMFESAQAMNIRNLKQNINNIHMKFIDHNKTIPYGFVNILLIAYPEYKYLL